MSASEGALIGDPLGRDKLATLPKSLEFPPRRSFNSRELNVMRTKMNAARNPATQIGRTIRRFISAQILGRSSGARIYGEFRTTWVSRPSYIGFSKFLRTSTVRRRITRRRNSPVSKGFLAKQSLVGRHNGRDRLLTLREREVLRWLARGKSNAEIGAILGISAATVGKHLEHIYPKLGVENRTAAASFASELTSRLEP